MVQGDVMKLKRWHLYVIVTVCFCIAYVAINRKYDRFYRVNGINNDNRALIEQYLDSDEQEYLIENAIAVNLFIKYIEIPDFNLMNYEFYNALDKTNKYSDLNVLVDVGNQLADKLEVSFASNSLDYCNTLIKYDLVDAYINQDDFDFDNIEFYQMLRAIYDETDYTYVKDTNEYLTKMQQVDHLKGDKLYENFKQLSTNYTKTSLATLFNHDLLPNAKRIYNPSELSLVVNNETFIGGYEPKKLVIASGIPRVKHFMYLQEETYQNLLEMYRACYNECGKGLILDKSFIGYDVALLEDRGVVAGYNEYQLGSTVDLHKEEISVKDFDQTDIFNWLINHCYEYGFILRYPADKVAVTNHEYSSTTFRYVGKEIATELHEQNLALEEYKVKE